MTATITVLLGAPGSGKSTLAAARVELGTVLSTDRARALLGGGEHDQTVDAHGWVREQADILLAEGQSVIIDATGYCRRDRSGWLALARRHRAHPAAIRVRTGLWTCLMHNYFRHRRVPIGVLMRMWVRLVLTSDRRLRHEGFRTITTTT